MHSCRLLVRTGIDFAGAQEALEHIGTAMLAAGVVHDSYPQALLQREASFPTGILLEQYAVAIPHCEAEHARAPALYLIRPQRPVVFAQADGEGTVDAVLIIALIVTDPSQQLLLLRTLFSQLQHPEFIGALLTVPEERLGPLFHQRIFTPATSDNTHRETEHQGATI